MSILIKNGYVLTLNTEGNVYEHGDVLISGDSIVDVGKNIELLDADQIIDATDRIVMPGLNIAHAHSWAQLFKGMMDGLPLEIWILGNNAPPLGWPFTREQLYLRTILATAEMIRNGVTTVWDDLMIASGCQDTIFGAYRDSGMRAVITAQMYDKAYPDRTLFVKDTLPQSLLAPLMGEEIRSIDDMIGQNEDIYSKWHGYDGRLNLSISVCWPQGSSDELMIRASEVSQKYNLPFITHALETKVQQVTGEVFYGKSIIEHLNELGVLTPRTSIVHGIWITDEDVRLLADNHTSVLHNPSSNLILGSGIMPYRKLKDAGVNIALGVDEGYQSKWNPFEMMRIAALLHKISNPDYHAWPTSDEIVDMATHGGARSELIHKDVGAIAKGMKADIILLDMNNLNFKPINNIKTQLVYVESGNSVVTSIINGKIVMKDRNILTINVDEVLEEASRMMPEYWRKQEERKTLEFSYKVRPYVENMYRRVAGTPTGINRWIGNEKDWTL